MEERENAFSVVFFYVDFQGKNEMNQKRVRVEKQSDSLSARINLYLNDAQTWYV